MKAPPAVNYDDINRSVFGHWEGYGHRAEGKDAVQELLPDVCRWNVSGEAAEIGYKAQGPQD